MKKATVVLLLLPLLLAAAPAKKAKVVHPEVDQQEACDVCHREVTPEVVEAWYQSRHGLFNVKCFVCHGSIGADFTRRAPTSRCVGCHNDKVESLSLPFFSGKDCFACHAGHELNPHKLAKGGGK